MNLFLNHRYIFLRPRKYLLPTFPFFWGKKFWGTIVFIQWDISCYSRSKTGSFVKDNPLKIESLRVRGLAELILLIWALFLILQQMSKFLLLCLLCFKSGQSWPQSNHLTLLLGLNLCCTLYNSWGSKLPWKNVAHLKKDSKGKKTFCFVNLNPWHILNVIKAADIFSFTQCWYIDFIFLLVMYIELHMIDNIGRMMRLYRVFQGFRLNIG